MKFRILRITPYKRDPSGAVHSKGKETYVDSKEELFVHLNEMISTILSSERLEINCVEG